MHIRDMSSHVSIACLLEHRSKESLALPFVAVPGSMSAKHVPSLTVY